MQIIRFLRNVLLIAVMALILSGSEVQAAGANGLQAADDGNWYYYNNGQIASDFTGLAYDENLGWWLLDRGRVAFEYNGLWGDPNLGWWLVEGGRINFDYTGLYCDANVGWWLVGGGRVCFEYNGLWGDPNLGWWLVEGGSINFGYTGLYCDANVGWWLLGGGRIAFEYNGLWGDPIYGWWLVEGGSINFGYTGLYCDANVGWWLVNGGTIAFNYNDLYCDANLGWWLVNGGSISFGYTGATSGQYGMWYVTNGTVDFGYNGTTTFEGKTYTVVNGQITGPAAGGNDGTTGGTDTTPSGEYQVGQVFSGAIETGVYIIRSNSNPDYALTAVPNKTAEGGYNLVMSKVDGGDDQKFMVLKENSGTYCFLSMAYLDKNGTNPDAKWLIAAYNGGFDPNAAGNADNVQIVSPQIPCGKSWYLEETSKGVYSIKVSRGDSYAFYMSVPTGVQEGANVVTTAANAGANQGFTFVSPYTKTLADGTYSIAESAGGNAMLAIAGSSIKDYAGVVTAADTAGTDQLFNIKCVDAAKGTYTIQNVNSQRYLYMKGSIEIGAPALQIRYTGALDQTWYIQKNPDGTYSIISAASNQVLTYGNANAAVTQAIGTGEVTQKFVIESRKTGAETLATGVYKIGDANYRMTSYGNGIYGIYSLTKGVYCGTAADGSMTVAYGDDASTAKWRIEKSGDAYTICNVETGAYLTANGQTSKSVQKLTVTDASGSIKDYNMRYNLKTFEHLNEAFYQNTQIMTRFNYLKLDRSKMLQPENSMVSVESAVNNAIAGLPTAKISFTGNTVKDLNKFMKNNTGKIVQLTQDIQVYIDKSIQEDGVITIPNNTILDGNGHSLVLKSGSEVPTVGVVFYHFDSSWNQVVSKNCGVINLTSAIAYEDNTVNAFGADNILIENNHFTNAGLNAIVITDKEDNNPTVNGLIKNNVCGTTGGDTIAVYGNNSNLIIEGNTVDKSGEYGIMLSCLRDGNQMPVNKEVDGPHDIIVRNNKVTNSEGCAIYCLGSYYVYITGNTLSNSKLEGICFDSGCIGSYFAGNTVNNNGLSGGLPGVSIDNSIYTIVDNNNVYENACHGIKMVRAGFANIIVNNICTNNCLYMPDSPVSAGISIEGRVVDPENEGCLDGYGSDCNVVIGNTIRDTKSAKPVYGVMIADDSATGKCANNVIMGNNTSASFEFGCVDFSTMNNDVRNNIIE